MKSVLISVQPQHVSNICTVIGTENEKPIYKKTIEVRKTRPKLETPFKCYIYETQGFCIEQPYFNAPAIIDDDGFIKYRGRGKVIGEFVCDWIYNIQPHWDIPDCVNQYACDWKYCEAAVCLSFEELKAYLGNKNGYGWHISDLKIYDTPKEMGEFRKPDTPFHSIEETAKGTALSDGWRKGEQLTRPPQSWCYVEENI